MLLRDAKYCALCGTSKGEGEASKKNKKATVNTSIPTTSSFKLSSTEGKKSKHFEATITDAFAATVSGHSIVSSFTDRVIGRPSSNLSDSVLDSSYPQQLQLLPNGENNSQKATVDVKASSVEEAGRENRFRNIFSGSGDRTKLIESRLKANSKLDAARRLTYIFLLYNADQERDEVPRDELTSILSQSSLNDSNTYNWIAKSSDLLVKDGMVRLLRSGREKAEQVLKEMLDPNVEGKWTQEKASSSRKTKTASKLDKLSGTAKAKNYGTGKTPTDVEDWITRWNSISANYSFGRLLKSGNVKEKGCFALWAIRTATKDTDVVASAGKLQKFLFKGLGFKVDESNLGQQLKAISGDGELIRVKGGFRLLQPGADSVEKALASKIEDKPLDILEEGDLWQDDKEAA